MICVSIRASTNEEALESIRRARQAGADLAELRIDFIRDPDIPRLFRDPPLPLIATVRPTWEGGRFEGTEADRVALLEDACLAGAEWVDVEFRAYKDFPRHQARLLLSFHDMEKTPRDLDRTVRKMAAMEPDLLKVATRAEGAADVLRLLELQKASTSASTFIPIGSWGEPLRILYRKFGGFLTYASLEEGSETAEGQLPLARLVRDYRIKIIDDETRVFGVVGNPVGHSRSPEVFNSAFRHLNINARYVLLPLDDPSLLREYLDRLEVEGASITVPHKRAVLDHLDEVDPSAQAIGAANTVTRREGRLYGTNTDVRGAMEAIRDAAVRRWNHGMYGMRALVVGAGGVARALAWGLQTEGAQVTIVNRTWERARALADELGCDALPIREIRRARPRILVHATSVGMTPHVDDMPPVEEVLHGDMLVFESVYTPRETRLLREARSRGAGVINGMDFFLRQADHQFQTWFGRKIPTELKKKLYETL